ncbi:MAG: dTDP-4-dehydrorhamnose 3,5-epimerase [Candidatus Acidiferrales bacterium]
MIFKSTEIVGAFLIEPEKIEDARGFFARTFCRREFGMHGVNARIAQCSVSFNVKSGTLRGMHYQAAPQRETKLVRCTRGAIFDALLDLRPESLTFGDWAAFELTAENHRMLYIPEGVAHGFQTLVDGTEVFLQMSEFYEPESARGVRWNDPAFGIVWPRPPSVISEQDSSFPLVSRDAH